MKKRKEKYALFRAPDLLILLIVLCLIGGTLFLIFSPEKGSAAEVYVEGRKVATLPLNQDKVLSLDHLKIIVSGGKVWVEESDCPNKICEKTGKISKKGQAIVCLPNKVAIRISGKGEVEAIV
ncbi:MAG: NusG domain II-containing protein [Clostridia bacterium]|nr:NusG domain II-containing protein [Clostridia bacterium]